MVKGSKGDQGDGKSIFHMESGSDLFGLMIRRKQYFHEEIMM